MTRYEALHAERRHLRVRQVRALAAPAVLIAVVAGVAAGSVLVGLVAAPAAGWLVHHAGRVLVPSYRERADRRRWISGEIAELRRRVGIVFDAYRERRKGEQFKAAYELAGKSVDDLEEALAVGMFRERREVFVTAFVRAGVAVRVTASMGSPYRCSAADDPRRWADHCARLRCDEIRQYHNHPAHDGVTRPSALDVRTSRALRSLLGVQGPKLRSLIICWNALREWKVFEYGDGESHRLCREFDAGHPARRG